MTGAIDVPLSRRTVIGAACSFVGAALATPCALAQKNEARVSLRVLATSDLHMFMVDWDYYRAKVDPTVGLVKVATLIRSARAEAANTLLFDNGDFIQGNPLADYVATHARPTPQTPHVMIQVMAELGYDAIGLGNHEFNYGLDFLEASLNGAPFPVVCANIARLNSTAPIALPYAVLDRNLKDETGRTHLIRIGVIGFVPPQIMTWDKARLDGRLTTSDIVLTARKLVPELRAKCDIVVALSHSGIKAGEWTEGEENASFYLSAVPGIDVIIAGHSHRVFPGRDYAHLEGIDAGLGKLRDIPAVMPGFWGSHLGVVDLSLQRSGEKWVVGSSVAETRPIYRRNGNAIDPIAKADDAVAGKVNPVHKATLSWVEQPVGRLETSVHSYFVWAGFDPCSQLVHDAQLFYARPLLASTQYSNLPVLSAVAPFRAGYTAESFVDIAPGQVSLRQVADLYIYSNNMIVAVLVTGAEITEWLEASARAFHQIDPAILEPQPLLERRVPSYSFDTISGLSYEIDIRQPPRYDARGNLNATARRIGDVRFGDKPIHPDQSFLVITNNYRGDGGGNFPNLAGGAKVVWRAPDTNQEAVMRYFRASQSLSPSGQVPWSFASIGNATAVYFDTGSQAAAHMKLMPGLSILGVGEPGYLRVAKTLG